MYATQSEQLRLTPCTQCTRQRPPPGARALDRVEHDVQHERDVLAREVEQPQRGRRGGAASAALALAPRPDADETADALHAAS